MWFRKVEKEVPIVVDGFAIYESGLAKGISVDDVIRCIRHGDPIPIISQGAVQYIPEMTRLKSQIHELYLSQERLRGYNNKLYLENKRLGQGNPLLNTLLEKGIDKTAEMVNKELVEENEKLKLKIESKPMRHARNQRKVIVRLQEEIIKLKESIKYNDLAFAEHKKCAEELVLERKAKETLVKDNDELSTALSEADKEISRLNKHINKLDSEIESYHPSEYQAEKIAELENELLNNSIPKVQYDKVVEQMQNKVLSSEEVTEKYLTLKNCCTEQEETIERMQGRIAKQAGTISEWGSVTRELGQEIRQHKSFLKSKKLTNAFRVWEKKKKLTK